MKRLIALTAVLLTFAASEAAAHTPGSSYWDYRDTMHPGETYRIVGRTLLDVECGPVQPAATWYYDLFLIASSYRWYDGVVSGGYGWKWGTSPRCQYRRSDQRVWNTGTVNVVLYAHS